MILRNREDLERLLDRARIPTEKRSVWLNDSNPEAVFATLAFCSSVWKGLVNPGNPRAIEYGPEARAPSRRIPDSWLAKGIPKEDIAAVVRDFQLDTIFRVLQTIEQFDIGAGDSSARFSLSAHDANADELKDDFQVSIDSLIVDLFVSAKPEDQPDVEYYV